MFKNEKKKSVWVLHTISVDPRLLKKMANNQSESVEKVHTLCILGVQVRNMKMVFNISALGIW